MAKDAQESTLYSIAILADYEQNRRFYAGDHWQDSRGYMGQLPPISSPSFATTIYNIRQGFVSENVIKEVTDRRLNGAARDPDWQFLRGKEKLSEATDQILVEWFDERDLLETVKLAARKVTTEQKTLVRMFVPYGFIKADGLPILPKMKDALRYVHFEVVDREKGGVYLDAARMQPYSIYNYTRRIGKKDVNFADITFTDEKNLTHLVTFKDIKSFEPEHLLEAARLTVPVTNLPDDIAITPEAQRLFIRIDETANFEPLDLGGHLYLFELEGEEFITEQIRSLQRMINLARTMGGKNINIAGVRQRDYLNADKPATVATGGSANFIYGVPIEDKDGKIIGMTSPNVSITDPSDPSYFIKTRDDAYAAILGQCGQKHVLISGNATVSGLSRIEARSEFIATLKKLAKTLDRFGRWMLEISFCFADAFSDEQLNAAEYRCEYKTVIDAGSVDNETATLEQLDVKENRLSLETYLNNRGVDDVAAELTRIKDNPAPVAAIPPTAPPNGALPVVK